MKAKKEKKSRPTNRPEGGDHWVLVDWAAECAARVLPHFEAAHPHDDRPRKALEAGRAWMLGEITFAELRAAALAAHAAARAVQDAAARAAARAAGQAAATGHVASHASAAGAYAVSAARCAAGADAADAERAWQHRHLPEHLRPIGFPERRRPGKRG